MGSPRHFSGQNTIFRGPPGLEDKILPLPVYRADSEIISCWELSEEERAEVARTGLVWVSISGQKVAPFLVSGTALMQFTAPDGESEQPYDANIDLDHWIEVATKNEWVARFAGMMGLKLRESGKDLTQPMLDQIVKHANTCYEVRNTDMSPELVADYEFSHLFGANDGE